MEASPVVGAVTIPVIIAFIELIVKRIFKPDRFSDYYPMIAIFFAVAMNIVGSGISAGWTGAVLWQAAMIGLTTGITAGYGYDKVVSPFKTNGDV